MADFAFETGAGACHLRIELTDTGYTIHLGDRRYAVQVIQAAGGALDLLVDGEHHRCYVTTAVTERGKTQRVWYGGQQWTLTPVDERGVAAGKSPSAVENVLTAAMPGQIRRLFVAAGESVAAGAPLVILEAMKMEIRVTAPAAGTVAALYCAVGDVVERGSELVKLDYQPVSGQPASGHPTSGEG